MTELILTTGVQIKLKNDVLEIAALIQKHQTSKSHFFQVLLIIDKIKPPKHVRIWLDSTKILFFYETFKNGKK